MHKYDNLWLVLRGEFMKKTFNRALWESKKQMRGYSRAGVREEHPSEGDRDFSARTCLIQMLQRRRFWASWADGTKNTTSKEERAWSWGTENGKWGWGVTWRLRGSDSAGNRGHSKDGTMFQQVPHSKDLWWGFSQPPLSPVTQRHLWCTCLIYMCPIGSRPLLNNIEFIVLGQNTYKCVLSPQGFP